MNLPAPARVHRLFLALPAAAAQPHKVAEEPGPEREMACRSSRWSASKSGSGVVDEGDETVALGVGELESVGYPLASASVAGRTSAARRKSRIASGKPETSRSSALTDARAGTARVEDPGRLHELQGRSDPGAGKDPPHFLSDALAREAVDAFRELRAGRQRRRDRRGAAP